MLIEFKETWFKKQEDNVWIEQNKYYFEESASDIDDCYKLVDKSRNVVLYLKKNGTQCIFNGIVLYENKSMINARTQYLKPDIYNPNSKIAVVMMYTPNIAHICCHTEVNILAYCNLHKYTCYIYKDTMTASHPTWNKPLVLKDNIENHEYIMWIDSDAIFTNFNVKIEDIIFKQPKKNMYICDDIGNWKLNAGVHIWKNCNWSINILNKWWNMKHTDHIKGGDQVQLIKLLTENDKEELEYYIFEQTEFNCHPKLHKPGMFILHMMGMSSDYRIKAMKYWNKFLIK
jgi:hypothetical protein